MINFLIKIFLHDFPGFKWEHRQLLWDQWDINKTIQQNMENRKKLVKY